MIRMPGNPPTSRRSLLRAVAAASAIAVASPVLTACGGDGSSTSGPQTYRIVQPSKDPLVVFAVSYLAEDKGYYKDEGLKIKRVLLPGGPASLQGLLSGAADALISTPGETLSAVAKGRDLKVLMGHTNNMPSTFVVSKSAAAQVSVTADSPLGERRAALGKIKGGRYGISAPGSQTDAFTRLALKQAGIEGDGAKIVPLQTASNCLAALVNGDIEGYVGVPPVGEQAVVQSGAVTLLTAQTGEIAGADTLPGMSLVVKGSDLKSKPKMYAAALKAEVRAMKDLNDDFEGAGELLRKTRFSKLSDPVWKATWESLRPSFRSPVVTDDSLGAWLDNGLIDAGAVTRKDVKLANMIDMSMVAKDAAANNWNVAK